MLSGKVIETIHLKKTISKPINIKQFAGSYTFFTGQLDFDISVETNSFTVCQTIDLFKFMSLIKSKEILKQSYHALKDELLLQQHFNKIKQKCFFCD